MITPNGWRMSRLEIRIKIFAYSQEHFTNTNEREIAMILKIAYSIIMEMIYWECPRVEYKHKHNCDDAQTQIQGVRLGAGSGARDAVI